METVKPEFKEFSKIARLSRDCVITEKIDGTNGLICFTEQGDMFVGSRSRWLSFENDNMNFYRWARDHEKELKTLGPGYHYGEWWGNGIQRNYGLKQGDKRWSLFNVNRWCEYGKTPRTEEYFDGKIKKTRTQDIAPQCCSVVPILYEGLFDTRTINIILDDLKDNGSKAAPGFMKPEGIVIFHKHGGYLFKKTIDKDEAPKSVQLTKEM